MNYRAFLRPAYAPNVQCFYTPHSKDGGSDTPAVQKGCCTENAVIIFSLKGTKNGMHFGSSSY